MANLRFGDVLILDFPFAEGQGSKRRPVMVLRDKDDGDVLVAKITSQRHTSVFDIQLNDWEASNLLSPSFIRLHKIQTVSLRIIVGQIGSLSSSDLLQVRSALKALFDVTS